MLCKIWEYLQITEGRVEQHSASDRDRAMQMLRQGCTPSRIRTETGIDFVIVSSVFPLVGLDGNTIGYYVRVHNPHIS